MTPIQNLANNLNRLLLGAGFKMSPVGMGDRIYEKGTLVVSLVAGGDDVVWSAYPKRTPKGKTGLLIGYVAAEGEDTNPVLVAAVTPGDSYAADGRTGAHEANTALSTVDVFDRLVELSRDEVAVELRKHA